MPTANDYWRTARRLANKDKASKLSKLMLPPPPPPLAGDPPPVLAAVVGVGFSPATPALSTVESVTTTAVTMIRFELVNGTAPLKSLAL